MYNYNLEPGSDTKTKLQTIDRLGKKMIGNEQSSIKNEIKKHSFMLVRKCVQRQTCKISKILLKSGLMIEQHETTSTCCKYQKQS